MRTTIVRIIQILRCTGIALLAPGCGPAFLMESAVAPPIAAPGVEVQPAASVVPTPAESVQPAMVALAPSEPEPESEQETVREPESKGEPEHEQKLPPVREPEIGIAQKMGFSILRALPSVAAQTPPQVQSAPQFSLYRPVFAQNQVSFADFLPQDGYLAWSEWVDGMRVVHSAYQYSILNAVNERHKIRGTGVATRHPAGIWFVAFNELCNSIRSEGIGLKPSDVQEVSVDLTLANHEHLYFIIRFRTHVREEVRNG